MIIDCPNLKESSLAQNTHIIERYSPVDMHGIIMGCVVKVQDELTSFSQLNGMMSKSGFSPKCLMEDSPL